MIVIFRNRTTGCYIFLLRSKFFPQPNEDAIWIAKFLIFEQLTPKYHHHSFVTLNET